MSRLSSPSELWEQKVSPFIRNREPNGGVETDDTKKTMSRVTQLIEQLHANKSSPPERELITARLLGIVKSRKEARSLIGSHSQAMPLFVSLLRNGTPIAKANVAATLSVLCKDDDLRLKVILGGCIPPLLTILKSETGEARKAAAEAVFKVTSSGLSDDPVGIRIFTTEGVVPALWQLMISDRNQDKVVEVFVTGSLRNLCTEKDGYWKTTLDAGGVDIVVKYLSADNPAAQSNAASLLARMVLASSECIPKIIGSGVINTLLSFLEEKNDVSLRASTAEALNVISSKSPEARKLITDAQGVALLIGAVVSPYKQGIEGEEADALQLHATRALANISGGMPALLVYLGELSQSSRLSAPVPDILGALAYALKVFERSPEAEQFDAKKIENFLMLLLKPRDNKLVQERLLQAMINLYGNAYLSKLINQSKTKRVLTGLILMAVADVKEYLILSMMRLCNQGMDIWESIRMREGVQLLISLLGLSGEQQQEYAVEMLAMLTDQVEDSKWAITAAGGIPPLVHLLDNGTLKAREYAAHALEILCSHSEDIRACVENADAIPSFLWLLKNGGPKGQETSASALKKLIRVGDAPTINQLSAMLQGDLPSSKTHIIPVLGHVLAMASSNDLVEEGAAANKGFRSLVQVLNSSNESTKECAAFTLSDLFSAREDICDSLATEELVNQCMKLLANDTPAAASHSARALGALSRLNKRMSTRKMSYADGDIKHLIRMAKTAPIVSAETAMAAMANLLSDPELATEALYEDVASALTRVLGEGSIEGKRNATRSLHQLLKYFLIPDILKGPAQRRFVVLGVAESLKAMAMDGNDAANALDIITLLAKIKEGANTNNATFSALAKVPSSSEPLVQCLSEGSPVVQDKAIEILSRLCMEQPAMLSGLLISKARSVAALAERIINSSLEVRIGGTALLICAARDYRHQSMDSLDASGYLKPLVFALVGMMKHKSKYSSLEIEVKTPRGYAGNAAFQEGDELKVSDSVTVSGSTLAMWLLSIISSFHAKSKVTIVEAGGLDILADRLAKHTANQQEGFEDSEGLWISTLLLALLFQDPNVVSSPTTIRFVPIIAMLLKSEEVFNQFFAAQALSSLVSHRNEGINLAVSNSDAIGGLMTLIGHTETDIPNLFALFIEFSLVTIPDQVVLQCLFEIEDVRAGSIARKTIPLLVDLLKPMPNKCGAPPFAVRLLTQIADGNDTNKLIMAEAGALNGLNKYLCLNPQDLTEATISELLRVLFGNHNLLKYEAATSCMINLVGVVRLGSRSARLSAISALNELFGAENIRACEASMQAVQPLVEVLESASESEQHATISTLIKLTSDSNPRAMLMTISEPNPLEILYKILTSSSSLELKSDAAKLCFIIFSDPKSRTVPIASQCMEPLISLIQSGYETAVESGICAFERLLDEEQQVELASTFDLVDLLVGLVSGTNYRLIEASVCAMIKLGKDRTPRKLDMVKAGIIDNCLQLLPVAPISVCSTISELFRVLTNSSAISRSPAAAKIVEPLFTLLRRPDFGLWGQHSVLQALVNILEKPQSLDALKLTPSQAIQPLITFLESPSHAILQLGTELLSHLLEQEHFKQDIMTKNAVVPLVQLAGIGILNLQQTAIKALENISLNWPNEVADAGGIFELSKFIIQDDPQPPDALLELAAEILCNVLRSDSEYYLKVPLVVLVKILYSTSETSVMVALNALTLYESTDPSSAELMAEAGVIDALIDLLRSHQCEEPSGKLLEALFNKDRVREMKVSKYAIAPLAQYLLDPQTRSQPGTFLATLALGDLSRHEGLARASDSAFACRALIRVLTHHRTEEVCIVVISALQNFILRSRNNRRAVADAGGILAIQELLLSPNTELVLQSAILLRCLFSNHTLQDCVSNELIKSLTAVLEKQDSLPTPVIEEILRTFLVVFSTFPKLHASEAATLCIPHIVAGLNGSSATQELVLAPLMLLKQSWPSMPVDMSKAQATAASEAILALQTLLKNCPPALHDKLESLLHCLPGCLTVTIKRASSLKSVMGGTNAFCRLKVGNGPARQTKVVYHSTSPEWNEVFTWAFDVPPTDQKLYILCRSKNTFGKTTLGRVSIQIDKIVGEGTYSEVFTLSSDTSKDGSARTLEVEVAWSNNRTSNEGE
ncbi:protein CELLULOSE SYNTHASE INTERACTIVE 3 [Ipomoea triloba]|uniref:protein CELLULOSE SYNTHASE INTERACTIVE 3 n=1 Tax=Ipomoea triloba TaxID=35885 RepID=UPI00125D6E24|nr:protein CELLULOSE SYNTHASE INTERACTIVE 3 [Ipomoea triloba]